MWDKVLKNEPSKICGRQPLKNFARSIKICGRQPLKNFTWSILQYFAPYNSQILMTQILIICKTTDA